MNTFLKNPRVLIWIFFIVVSIIVIAPNPNPHGFVVVSVNRTIVNNIDLGEVIYTVDDKPATADMFNDNYFGIVKIGTGKGIKYVNLNGTLGIGANSVPSTNIRFGLDIKGGVRAILEPNVSTNATLDQVISTLEERINFYGLRESVFKPIYYEGKGFIEVNIAGGTKEELKNLIESQGNFEARIPFTVSVTGNQFALKLDKNYAVPVENSSIVIDGKNVHTGEPFYLSGIDFMLNDINSGRVNITAKVFGGDDVVTVFLDPQRTRIEKLADGYSWTFSVQLSKTGAQKFAYVTNNINQLATGYLESPIVFYLDGNLVDSLNIASSLKGRTETEIAISGGADTQKESSREMVQLQSILRSGALPTTVEIVQLDTVSPTLGAGFLKSAIFAALAALLGVIIFVSLRYRKPKLVVPMIFISITEILIVIGVSTIIGWTVDLAAIAGIIASVGTGISDQIIILDRALRKEGEYEETLHEKIKKAFFVVFGTAGTVIAAMLPLMFIGFGLLRGFALITIIGVLVGILVTRPTYGVIIERLMKE